MNYYNLHLRSISTVAVTSIATITISACSRFGIDNGLVGFCTQILRLVSLAGLGIQNRDEGPRVVVGAIHQVVEYLLDVGVVGLGQAGL
jgi:hypothetical protein